MSTYLVRMYETGEALVDASSTPNDVALLEDLRTIDDAVRLEMPGHAPEFDAPSALWAARMFYAATRFACIRRFDETDVIQGLSLPCPREPDPASSYSADLSFRFLPGLIALTSQLARKDPLVERLLEFARSWPLSSVGTRDLGKEEFELGPIMSDPCLKQVYLDRIYETRDRSRLHQPEVCDLMKRNFGGTLERYPEWMDVMAEVQPHE
ncbi:MAG: hypothetical protein AAF492_06020 [Verrucomicrobiota bacterium]